MPRPAVVVANPDVSSLRLLTLEDVAAIYRLSPSTIRRGLQNGTFRPQPWDRYPYRWRREDIELDLTRRRDLPPRRPHGFAKRGRPAKAGLDGGPRSKKTAS